MTRTKKILFCYIIIIIVWYIVLDWLYLPVYFKLWFSIQSKLFF